MDIRELKSLLKNSASVLILDDGEPAFVILDYQVYKNMSLDKPVNGAVSAETPSFRHIGDQPIMRNPHLVSEKPAQASGAALNVQDVEAIEQLNKEILALKHQIELEERALAGDQDGSQKEE